MSAQIILFSRLEKSFLGVATAALEYDEREVMEAMLYLTTIYTDERFSEAKDRFVASVPTKRIIDDRNVIPKDLQ